MRIPKQNKIKQIFCLHGSRFTVVRYATSETERVEWTCNNCGKDLLKLKLHPRALLMSMVFGFLFAHMFASLFYPDSTMWFVFIPSFYGGMLLFAFWLERYSLYAKKDIDD